MDKRVIVTYRLDGKVVTEESLLIDQKSEIFVSNTDISTKLNGFNLAKPGTLLLEDDEGLWYLPLKDLIEIKDI